MTPSSERPLAVVTGASTGIGLELARHLAAEGFALVVVAEEPEIRHAAEELRLRGADAEPIQVDLSTAAGVEELHRRLQAAGRPIDVLCLNAGVGNGGAFAVDTPLERELLTVDVNVRAVVHLAGLLVPEMQQRAAGRVLFTSSIAAT